ncbi:cubilin-like [Scyliorhinus canicula]|uniref:cubilin-like n=1 Tax=Scyliorhinus canicula TaxID=7830 RepID=UPI0018F4535C|nr:cubilin-like [Scyliorhinus canicula]
MALLKENYKLYARHPLSRWHQLPGMAKVLLVVMIEKFVADIKIGHVDAMEKGYRLQNESTNLSVFVNILFTLRPCLLSQYWYNEANHKPSTYTRVKIGPNVSAGTKLCNLLKYLAQRLEVSLLCSNDYVAIYDGASTDSPLIATICTGSNHTFTSSSNTMTICFKSDRLKTNAGFTAYYYSQPLFQNGITCGGKFETENGSFTSPNYPEPYPNNAKCIWYIQVAKQDRITLKLDTFQYGNDIGLSVVIMIEMFADDGITCGGKFETESGSFTSPNYPEPYPNNAECIWYIQVAKQDRITLKLDGFQYGNDIGLSVVVTIEMFADDGITCGGRFETESGSFTSPNYPEPYPNNAECIWYIQVAKRDRITLKLDGFQLEVSLWCSNDYVAIYDGASTNSPLIAIICTGSNHTFTSSSNTMTICFKSDHLKTSAGFTAYYYSQPLFQITTGLDGITCGGRLETESGSFTSPNYPEPYPNNAECIWYIQVKKRHTITLNLDGFQLEVSLRCTNDYVAIYDGASTNSPLISTICTGSNHTFTSSSNTMTICFKSDHLKTSVGFTAYYYSQPLFQITTGLDGITCGGRLETESGSFTSPNYPEPYPNNAECIWYLQVKKRHTITLNLDGFQLEVSLRCTNDYVAIYDGASTNSPLISTICTGSNHTFTSSSNTMTICFKSDHLKTSVGFTAYYYSQPLFQITTGLDGITCGGRLETESGSFTSPNYPEPYPNNAECIWYIQVKKRHTITLNLDGFQLEVSLRCTNDYVAIYDGASTNSPLISTICTGSNHTFTSSSNTMTICFKSDHLKTSVGFTAYYYSQPLFQITTGLDGITCGGRLETESGSFTSPNYPEPYPNNAECIWYIQVKKRHTITLNLDGFQLEVSLRCTNDYVAIYDGASTNSPLISTICTGSNHTFTSSSNTMTICFKSDHLKTSVGFTAYYYSQPLFQITTGLDGITCGGRLETESGSFTSPNYPEPYPNNAECIWYIQVKKRHTITLNLDGFQLEVSLRCTNDYVAIYDGASTNSPLISTICTGSNHTFTSSSNTMTICFKSDHLKTSVGFTAYYYSQPLFQFTTGLDGKTCGGRLESGSGSFTSPNYPEPYPNNAECIWYIQVANGKTITLNLDDFQQLWVIYKIQFPERKETDQCDVFDHLARCIIESENITTYKRAF